MFDCDKTKENNSSALSDAGQHSSPLAPSPRKKRLRQALCALGVGALLCFGAGDFASGRIRGNTVIQRPLAAVSVAGMTRQQVIARARASVVWIYDQDCQKKGAGATGSGVIIDPRGYIVTNFHVVSGMFHFQVRLFDNSPWQPAQLVGVSPSDDLAVLKITTSKRLLSLSIGNSSQLQVGDSVVAIGNPGVSRSQSIVDYFPQSVTSGIISALGRVIDEGKGLGLLVDAVQTDAPINHGNSGGALVNMQDELVGIPTWGYAGTADGLGFAVPSNRVRFVVPQLIQYGKLAHSGHASIGVTATSVSAELAEQDGLPVSQGAFVTNVVEGRSGELAGLTLGDVIVRLNDMSITNAQDLTDALALVDPGSTVTLEIVRDGQHVRVNVKTYETLVKVASSWACPLKDAQPVVGKG